MSVPIFYALIKLCTCVCRAGLNYYGLINNPTNVTKVIFNGYFLLLCIEQKSQILSEITYL